MAPKISMNVTTTFHGNVVTDIKHAKAAAYTGIELQSPKLYRYLAAGYAVETLPEMLEGLTVTGLGAVLDIERQGAARRDFLAEVRRLCEVAVVVGAPLVQLCTGPVDWNVVRDFRAGRLEADDPRYCATLGLDEAEALRVTASNVRDAADIAAEHGLDVYLEPLAWARLNRCRHALQLIEQAGRDNVGIALDTWHFWTTGDTLDEVRALPKELIKAVHLSDGLELDRATEVPDQSRHRNVVIGGGSIPLQQWVDAIKSTGYDGWWVSEMFSTRADEQDPLAVATAMRTLLATLVG
ncbi:sugar phosphate isomerase/epimerase [Curtobacterium sp. ISL-83]|uniref:sugar phosphate isomerase/epimerase family protein n=1 Tax=Curtobacterium sp. ISL-83 TaxID=2819145 RepID=UPI001BE7720C|nr:sugar phosphate isomerase/epimerase family protein [Curtobacterium sp. ISL-83]MBT2503761.1 sugar phosphate isomerase/epimerase [Curtobacterium sp. ISL-83]